MYILNWRAVLAFFFELPHWLSSCYLWCNNHGTSSKYQRLKEKDEGIGGGGGVGGSSKPFLPLSNLAASNCEALLLDLIFTQCVLVSVIAPPKIGTRSDHKFKIKIHMKNIVSVTVRASY